MAKRAFSPKEISMFIMANKNSATEDGSGSDDSDSELNNAASVLLPIEYPLDPFSTEPLPQQPIKKRRTPKKPYKSRSGRSTRTTILNENSQKVTTFANNFPYLLDPCGVLISWIPRHDDTLSNLGLEAKPIDFLNVFLNEQFWTMLVNETNRYAQQFIVTTGQLPMNSKYQNWVPVNADEMKAFIALCIAMGLCSKPNIADYWSSYWITETPSFSNVMKRNRYNAIRGFLHFNDNKNRILRHQPGYDPLFKVRPLIDSLLPVFIKYYRPVPPAKHKTQQEIEAETMSKQIVHKTISEYELTRTGPEMKMYPFPHGSKKWYVRIFDGLTSMAIINSHTAYLQHSKFHDPTSKTKKIDLRQYMEIVCMDLLSGYKPMEKSISRRTIPGTHNRITQNGHFIEIINGQRRKACEVCSDRKRHHGRRQTRFQCSRCVVPLCPNSCFKRYHTMTDYKLCHLDEPGADKSNEES